jgi:hypothetical protein
VVGFAGPATFLTPTALLALVSFGSHCSVLGPGGWGLDAEPEPEAELIASSRMVVTTHLSGGWTLDGNVDATATTRIHTVVVVLLLRRVSTHGSPNRGLINDPTISFQC